MTRNQEQQPLRIGLTGGIASGKSVVADMFGELGVPVIDTDIIAREVVAPGQAALDEIRARFGDHMIDAAGNLDRAAMREAIFTDSDARLDLEAILHPRIGVETRRQADEAGGDYQLIVVPLLVGSPLLQFVDRVLVVDCEEETQVRRLLERDTETAEQARLILAAQASREQRLAIADDVVNNDHSLAHVRDQVEDLDRKYHRLLKDR
ncbi:MAG: dephospho-CoA kinase [Gammaproteobacteria bacterium]|nr:dephospho-CoA kinase [Gammaproteobacteria bacterium]